MCLLPYIFSASNQYTLYNETENIKYIMEIEKKHLNSQEELLILQVPSLTLPMLLRASGFLGSCQHGQKIIYNIAICTVMVPFKDYVFFIFLFSLFSYLCTHAMIHTNASFRICTSDGTLPYLQNTSFLLTVILNDAHLYDPTFYMCCGFLNHLFPMYEVFFYDA